MIVENSFSSSALIGKHLCDKSIIRCEVRCLKYHKMQTRCKAEYLFRQKLIRVITDPLGFCLLLACLNLKFSSSFGLGQHPWETHFLPGMSGPGLPISLYERVKVGCYMDKAPNGWGSFPSSSPRHLSSVSLDFTPDPNLFMSQSSLILSLKTAQCYVCRDIFTFSAFPHLFSNSPFFRALLAVIHPPYPPSSCKAVHLRASLLAAPSPFRDLSRWCCSISLAVGFILSFPP